MRWASAVSENPDTLSAFVEAATTVQQELGSEPDLVLMFVSPRHLGRRQELSRQASAFFSRALVMGCSANGVIGGGREVGRTEALSIVAASMPGVTLTPVRFEHTPELANPAAWRELVGVDPSLRPHFLILPDPKTCHCETLVRGLDQLYPGSQKLGGLASCGSDGAPNTLFLEGETYVHGAVAVAMHGDIEIDTIVAQSCRPVGKPMIITRVEDNVVYELDAGTPVQALRDLYEKLSATDQELCKHSLFVGIEMRDQRHEYRQGDFLIREVLGMDPNRGAMAVSALPRPYQVVQFHLRDPETSTEELTRALRAYREANAGIEPSGALLFSGHGSGQGSGGRGDPRCELFRRQVGSVPLGGFFCDGEIGSIDGTTFIHGSTISVGVFRPRRARAQAQA